ncbi:MAG TPA: hypothetical protein V6C58_06790, partial [Allocoleopsis sp.]
MIANIYKSTLVKRNLVSLDQNRTKTRKLQRNQVSENLTLVKRNLVSLDQNRTKTRKLQRNQVSENLT